MVLKLQVQVTGPLLKLHVRGNLWSPLHFHMGWKSKSISIYFIHTCFFLILAKCNKNNLKSNKQFIFLDSSLVVLSKTAPQIRSVGSDDLLNHHK